MNMDEPDPLSTSEPPPDDSAATGPSGEVVPTGRSNASQVPAPGPFPLEALSSALRNLVEATANVHRIDPALPGMSALVVLGAAPGKNLWVTGAVANHRQTPCNLYAVIAAPMSYGKSAAASIASPVIAESERRAAEYRTSIHPCLQRDSEILINQRRRLMRCLAADVWSDGRSILAHERQRLEGELADIARELAAINVLLKSPPTLYAGSYTTPALVSTLIRNGEAMLLYSTEAGEIVRILLGRFSGDGRPAFDLYLAGYTVEPWNEGRVSRGNVSIVPCLSVLWLCQPSVLREVLEHEEAFDRGLIARFLAFELDQNEIPHDDGVRREVPDDVRGTWDAIVQIGLKIRDLPEALHIPCTPEAREAFVSWHNQSVQYRNGPFHHIQGALGRWREQAIRISACLALAEAAERGERPTAISLDCAERAIALARWACLSSLELIHVGRRDRQRPLADRLTRLLVDAGGSQTLRNLGHHNGMRDSDVRMLAAAFPERFRVRLRKGPGAGRPSEIVEFVR